MNLITQLLATKNQTEQYFDLLETDLQKTYQTGKWSVRKILIHLADTESVLHERLKRVIAEPKQVIWAFNQDLWSEHLEYDNFPLEISKSLFVANRNSVIFLAEKFYQQLGHKQFVHSETGLRTLKDEFEKIAMHNERHLQQIEIALKS